MSMGSISLASLTPEEKMILRSRLISECKERQQRGEVILNSDDIISFAGSIISNLSADAGSIMTNPSMDQGLYYTDKFITELMNFKPDVLPVFDKDYEIDFKTDSGLYYTDKFIAELMNFNPDVLPVFDKDFM